MIHYKIPMYRPVIGPEEEEASLRVLRSKVLSRGEETVAFEEEFAKFIGAKHAVAVSSGTAGLHLAVRHLNWKEGDEVITTPFSFIASANCLRYENVTPVFADIDSQTLNMDAEEIEGKITPRTKGLLLVNIFGLPSFTPQLDTLRKHYNLDVIEDCCESIAENSESFPVHRFGGTSVYGFYANKQMTTGGEGGMIATNDPVAAALFRSLRDQGRSDRKQWLDHVALGYNYRITELQAALGRVQLQRLPFLLARRERIADLYNYLLSSVPGVRIPFESGAIRRSWFVYFVQLESKELREHLLESLAEKGIASQRYFPSLHRFPEYRKLGYHEGMLSRSEHASDTTLALPLFPDLTLDEIEQVTTVVRNSCTLHYRKVA